MIDLVIIALAFVGCISGITAFLAAVLAIRRKVNKEIGQYKKHIKYHPKSASRKLHV